MTWYPFIGSPERTSRIAARTSPRRTLGPRAASWPSPNRPCSQGGGPWCPLPRGGPVGPQSSKRPSRGPFSWCGPTWPSCDLTMLSFCSLVLRDMWTIHRYHSHCKGRHVRALAEAGAANLRPVDRYGADVLGTDWRAPRRGRAVEVQADKGLVV